jgi:pyrroline-5-carboxylate reductase
MRRGTWQVGLERDLRGAKLGLIGNVLMPCLQKWFPVLLHPLDDEQKDHSMKLGFIGTGVISEATIRGLMKSDVTVEKLLLSRRSEAISTKLASDFDCVEVLDDNQAIVDGSDIIVLVVRPQIAEQVLSGLSVGTDKQVISLVATLTHQTMASWFGKEVSISRAIPLPFVEERLGVTAIYPNQAAAHEIFAAVGTVVVADTQGGFDRYGVASATMGIYFESLSTLSTWMEQEGTPPRNAQTYLAALFNGLNHTARNNIDKPFSEQVPEHCTPGGLNEQGVNVFREQGGKDALIAALDSLKDRIANTK